MTCARLRNAALGVLNDPSMSLNDHGRRKIEMKIQKLKLKKKFSKIFRSEKKSKYFLCLGFVGLKRTSCRSETMCGILILNFNFEKFYLFFKGFPHFNRKYITNEEQWGPGIPLVGKRKQKYAN